METLEKIDKYLIDKMQTSYLWLLDRTGLFAASFSMMVFGPAISIGWQAWRGLSPWVIGLIFIPVVGINLAFLCNRYLQQGSGDYTMFNAVSLSARSALFVRVFVVGFLLGLIIGELLTTDWLGIFETILWITYQYCLCIMIRDREKKPFFKELPKPATQSM